MSIPVFQGIGAHSANATAIAVPWPTHQKDDVAFLLVNTSNQAPSLFTAAGFVQVGAFFGTGTAATAGSVGFAIYWNRASTGSMANPMVADSGDHQICYMITVRGCITTGNPWDVFSTSDVAAAATTAVTFPSVTTTVVDTLILNIIANGFDAGSPQVSGWTNGALASPAIAEKEDWNHIMNLGGGIAVACGGKATIGATGSTTATLANAAKQARFTIALKPAAAATQPAPTFQAAGTPVSGTGSVTPAWPTHLENDIALLLVTSSNEAISLTTANGFVEIPDSPQFTGTAVTLDAIRIAVYWCRATSSSMSAPVVADSGNHTNAQILTFRGCITTGNPWDVTAGDNLAVASSTITIPGDTTTVDNCLVVAIVGDARFVTSVQYSGWTNTDLAGTMLEIADFHAIPGSRASGFGAACGVKTTLGAYGATTASLPGSTHAVQGRISIALKPPAGSSPGPGDITKAHARWRIKLANNPGAGPDFNRIQFYERAGVVGADGSLVNTPAQAHPGTTHVQPMFAVNWDNELDATGVVDFDYFGMTLPAGMSVDQQTDFVTRQVSTVIGDDGVIVPGVGQNDGATALPLVKGVVRGTGKDGDPISFQDFGRIFQKVPHIRIIGGIGYEPRAANWTGTYDATKPQYPDYSPQDLDEHGFTISARLRQKNATITNRSLGFAGTTLDTVNETDTIATLTNAPANDDRYTVVVNAQAETIPGSAGVFRVFLDYEIETSIDSGATWQTRATGRFTFSDDSGGVGKNITPTLQNAQQPHTFSVAGLTNTGTSRVRVRLIGISTSGLGSYTVSKTWLKGSTGTTYPTGGFNFSTSASADRYASKTPDADDFVTWEAYDPA